MSDARRYGTSYFNPHPKSRLAFLEACVLIWCEADAADTPPTDDPGFLATVENVIRRDVERRLPGAPAETIDHFTRVGIDGHRSSERARYLESVIEKSNAPRPPKGNLRREIPKHLPLRPTRTIVAETAWRISLQNPEMSRSAVYAQTAQWLNDGLTNREAAHKLTGRNVRSACEAHGIFDSGAAISDRRLRASLQRPKAHHRWDATELDWGESYLIMTEHWGFSLESAITVRDLNIRAPLKAFESIYRQARAGKRFAGLYGVELAKAIDATLGLREMALQDLDKRASSHPQNQPSNAQQSA